MSSNGHVGSDLSKCCHVQSTQGAMDYKWERLDHTAHQLWKVDSEVKCWQGPWWWEMICKELVHSMFIYGNAKSKEMTVVTVQGTQIAKFMEPTWGPPGSYRPQMGPMLAHVNLAIRVVVFVWFNLYYKDMCTALICFVLLWLYYPLLRKSFIAAAHILQVCIIGSGTNMQSPHCQSGNLEGYC